MMHERMSGDALAAMLTRQGNAASRKRKAAIEMFKHGNLLAAANMCTHGWGYPLDSKAAEHENDPRSGQPGFRCMHCGSALNSNPFDGHASVVAPCEFRPFI